VRDCRHKICSHPREKRLFTETMTLVDCLYLEEIGCGIVKIFEANLYFRAERIFEKFLKFTSRNKIRHSRLPKGIDADAFCQKVNSEMEYDDSLKLKPSSLDPNEHKKYMYKTMENSLFGKFAQAEHDIVNTIVPNQQRLEDHFNTGKLVNYEIQAKQAAIVTIKNSPPRISQKSNSIISAYILSYAKIRIHRAIIIILNANGQLYHYSTDQIIYTMPKELGPLFPNFEISENSKTGEVETTLKCQGITSNTIESRAHFDAQAIRRDLKRSIEENVTRTMKIPQTKRRKLSNNVICRENLIFNVHTCHRNNRIVIKSDKTYDTVPLGYKQPSTCNK